MMLFFFNDTANTAIYTYLPTLSLSDALPISGGRPHLAVGTEPRHALCGRGRQARWRPGRGTGGPDAAEPVDRSEEHTSELQSLMRISYAVFCLKKKK